MAGIVVLDEIEASLRLLGADARGERHNDHGHEDGCDSDGKAGSLHASSPLEGARIIERVQDPVNSEFRKTNG